MFNSPSLEINIFQGCFFLGGGGTGKFMMILSSWWTIPYHNVYPSLFSIMLFELNDIFANINILISNFFCLEEMLTGSYFSISLLSKTPT